MRYVRDLSGIQTPQVTEIPIAAATNISAGAVTSLSAGLAIAAVNNLETKINGVTENGHTGAADTLATWNNATKIREFTSPTAVFAYPAQTITATTNSTTNTVEATGIAAFSAANVFKGGYLELKTKGASSTITDPIGTRKIISASDATNKTFTAAFTGAVVAGDTLLVYPPVGFKEGEFSSDSTQIILTAATNSNPMQVVDWDFDKKEVNVMPRLHVSAPDNV